MSILYYNGGKIGAVEPILQAWREDTISKEIQSTQLQEVQKASSVVWQSVWVVLIP